eukprot:2619618-Amphidinium_carterae.1
MDIRMQPIRMYVCSNQLIGARKETNAATCATLGHRRQSTLWTNVWFADDCSDATVLDSTRH